MRKNKLVLCLLFAIVTSGFNTAYCQTSKDLIVMVKYKTIPGKDTLALTAMKTLLAKVRSEPHYVNISVHIDPSDRSNILLYEQWSNEDYYRNDHMKTTHLQSFISESRAFLSGPPEISFWTIHDQGL